MSRLVPGALPYVDSCFMEETGYHTMYYDTWALPNKKFTNIDGLHSGVPTRTTPTLTPTTLRNIEQTFFELTRETERPHPHHNEAGFVPPVIEPSIRPGGGTYMSLVDSKAWIGGSTTITAVQPHLNRPTVVSSASSLPIMQAAPQTRRNMGGRRPIKSSGISPEEEERRRVRRERNKQAAARCRKRRLDHTNELLIETEGLEMKKQDLQNQIHDLQQEKDHLEFILEAHSQNCRLTDNPPSPPDIKPIVFTSENRNKVIVKQEPKVIKTSSGNKPSRPSSLPVAAFTPHKPATTILEVVAGVPITTPSSGIPFNFDSLMEGGTGLTPVSSSSMIPSCSSQQRNGGVDLSSPDATFPNKLVSL